MNDSINRVIQDFRQKQQFLAELSREPESTTPEVAQFIAAQYKRNLWSINRLQFKRGQQYANAA